MKDKINLKINEELLRSFYLDWKISNSGLNLTEIDTKTLKETFNKTKEESDKLSPNEIAEKILENQNNLPWLRIRENKICEIIEVNPSNLTIDEFHPFGKRGTLLKDNFEEVMKDDHQKKRFKDAMKHYDFLMENILPEIKKEGGNYEVVSGYHRIWAAIQKGKDKIKVLQIKDIPPIKKLPVVELKSKEAKELADLFTILNDLDFVFKVLTKLLELSKKENRYEEDFIIETLWTSAAIVYARCFTNGKRFSLTKKIYKDLKGTPFEVHEYYINLRNKHIAHSVNPFEQVKVGAILEFPEKEKKFIGIVKFSIKYISPQTEGIKNFMILIDTAKKHTQRRFEEINNKVHKKAKEIPLDELYKREFMKIITPGTLEDTKKTRKS